MLQLILKEEVGCLTTLHNDENLKTLKKLPDVGSRITDDTENAKQPGEITKQQLVCEAAVFVFVLRDVDDSILEAIKDIKSAGQEFPGKAEERRKELLSRLHGGLSRRLIDISFFNNIVIAILHRFHKKDKLLNLRKDFFVKMERISNNKTRRFFLLNGFRKAKKLRYLWVAESPNSSTKKYLVKVEKSHAKNEAYLTRVYRRIV